MLWIKQYNHSAAVLTKKNALQKTALLSTSCNRAKVFGFFEQFLLSACCSLFFCGDFTVDRRTGGLESKDIASLAYKVVDRRTGGLET